MEEREAEAVGGEEVDGTCCLRNFLKRANAVTDCLCSFRFRYRDLYPSSFMH